MLETYPASLGGNARLIGEGRNQDLNHFGQLGSDGLSVELADATDCPDSGILDESD
jgi:hypothetical protein